MIDILMFLHFHQNWEQKVIRKNSLPAAWMAVYSASEITVAKFTELGRSSF